MNKTKTKAVSQAAKVAPKAGPAGMQRLGQAMRGNPRMAPRDGAPTMGAPPPPKLQFMSDKLRGGAAGAPTMGAGMQGLGQAMGSMPQGSPAKLGQLGAAMGKTMGGMGMKKGGKVSSASSRADGCAVKGKTKGRMV